MMLTARAFLLICLCGVLAACAGAPRVGVPQIERDAMAERMLRDIEVLASDEFGGRKPGTPGGEKTVAYLIERMKGVGLVSGTNDPGSTWRAPVRLVSTRPLDYEITVRTASGSTVLPLAKSAAYSLSSRVLIDGVDVVFIGSGQQELAPQEITGRIVVVLHNPLRSSAFETVFAAAPAAVIGVVPNQAALTIEKLRLERERLVLASEASDRLTAFVTRDALSAALPSGEWDRLVELAREDGFRSERLEATIAIDVHSVRREFTSSNVIGLLPGQLPGSGAVFLLAHWDHLGECAPDTPDPICNGAVDNASGLALMLELAQRLQANGPHDRDIYFLATSAEEAGLLGAKAFVDAPPVPLSSIVAAFNIDSTAVAQAGGSVGFIGEGRGPLDPLVEQVVSESGVELGNREFAESFLRRHDGWVLLEQGVPAVLVSTTFASEIVFGPYFASRYHRPSDEAVNLAMGGAVDDLLLHEELVKRTASTVLYPAADQADDATSDVAGDVAADVAASQ